VAHNAKQVKRVRVE